MSSRVFTWQELLQALTVETIWRLWNSGKYKNNRWLKMIVSNWLDVWADWRTDLVMRGVDHQTEQLRMQWDADDTSADFKFTEKKEGATLLGGEMRLRAPYMDREEP
ncbi:MAG: hypothetical protein CMH53_04485 [Myxococcales bacterium]|nr:hypothetical protein [Myxococcales bacterium]|tara:strand:+ start:36 stop:356 length:321 start_codon:yes stop_codon:yes gene_type:complete